jgi:hypothetical protein
MSNSTPENTGDTVTVVVGITTRTLSWIVLNVKVLVCEAKPVDADTVNVSGGVTVYPDGVPVKRPVVESERPAGTSILVKEITGRSDSVVADS